METKNKIRYGLVPIKFEDNGDIVKVTFNFNKTIPIQKGGLVLNGIHFRE